VWGQKMKNKLTWREAASAWHRGHNVWSVEMGGIGPGYEQAIQILVFEIMHQWPNDKPLPVAIDKQWPEEYSSLCRKLGSELNLGLSGAQGGAAMNLAYRFMKNGYDETLDSTPQDRRIQVSKNFPDAPQ